MVSITFPAMSLKYPIELVYWEDSGLSQIGEPWTNIVNMAREAKLSVVTTVGMIVHEDDEVICLVQSIDEKDDTGFHLTVIAKSAIRTRISLAE